MQYQKWQKVGKTPRGYDHYGPRVSKDPDKVPS